MTNEEVIESLKKLKSYHNGSYGTAIDMAIKALEQQPCEDYISREEAIRVAEQGQIQGYEWQFKKLCTLPSVTPQPKIGKWIDDGWYAEGHSEHAYRCSKCDKNYIGYVGEHKYCPNCGAKMEVEK